MPFWAQMCALDSKVNDNEENKSYYAGVSNQ